MPRSFSDDNGVQKGGNLLGHCYDHSAKTKALEERGTGLAAAKICPVYQRIPLVSLIQPAAEIMVFVPYNSASQKEALDSTREAFGT